MSDERREREAALREQVERALVTACGKERRQDVDLPREEVLVGRDRHDGARAARAGEDHTSATADDPDRVELRVDRAGRLDHDVGAAGKALADRRDEPFATLGDGVGGTEGAREGATLGASGDDDDLARPCGRGGGRGEEADGTGADDDDLVAEAHAAALDGADRDGERLDEHGGLQVEPVGDAVDHTLAGHDEVGGVPAGERAGRAGDVHARLAAGARMAHGVVELAEVVAALAAPVAAVAGHEHLDGDGVADLEPPVVPISVHGADGDDDAHELVPGDERERVAWARNRCALAQGCGRAA
ncbi:hypothetical protein L1785_08470 [Antribacter sp. KLBMP9083]|uniref:Uncharacterized protein n=1 Tax=Antribacter soli TaxID=2910976 RepID=A0AA41QF88_9MICO|nr:hypothetical protein [Antribacter soli]MCF4121014.1 hypothetical protein [Antribacter soli]